ncbi:MAG: hypothetical protein ACPLPV_04215, partial [Methanomassiliicoccales archaeon]
YPSPALAVSGKRVARCACWAALYPSIASAMQETDLWHKRDVLTIPVCCCPLIQKTKEVGSCSLRGE